MSINDVSRRHFFFGSLLAGAVPAAGFGSVPSLRALGYKPFYDKLNVAAIGCGGQGGADLNDAARTENPGAPGNGPQCGRSPGARRLHSAGRCRRPD